MPFLLAWRISWHQIHLALEPLAPCVGWFMPPLCRAFWTISRCSQLYEEEALSVVGGSGTRTRLIGVGSVMNSFNFIFDVMPGKRLLQHTDNLSKTLQNTPLSASEAQSCAKLTAEVLQRIRDGSKFELLSATVIQMHSCLDAASPILPRKQKAPAGFQEGASNESGFHHSAVKDKYCTGRCISRLQTSWSPASVTASTSLAFLSSLAVFVVKIGTCRSVSG